VRPADVNLDTISHRLSQLALIALALFIPFSIAGANIAIGFGLLAWTLSALAVRTGRGPDQDRPSVLRDPLLPVSVLLVVSAFPSVIISEDFTRAINDWSSYWLLLVYFMVAANLSAHRVRETAFWVLFAATIVSSLVAFVQRAGGFDFWFIHIGAKHRAQSTLFTMTFAGILYQAIILNFSVALRKGIKGWRTIVLWAGLAVQFTAIILTVTRGAWVALFAGLAAVCLLIRNKTVLLVSAAAVAVVLVFAFVSADYYGRSLSPVRFVRNMDIEASTRLVLWDISWDLFKKHPLLGVGMGDFSTEASKLVGDRRVTTITDAHNVYLQVLATSGLVGFLPFVLFWVVLLRTLFRFKRRLEKGSLEWHYAVAAIGVTAAVLFGALTENNVGDEEVFIAFMFILGLTRSAEYVSGRADAGVRETDETADTSDSR
jgi:putative inorganic carbon (HCO3(-)) transporter